jgi:hypothetical protein
MSSPIIILKSYTVKSTTVLGNFPIYIQAASQCCIDANGVKTIQPISIPQK